MAEPNGLLINRVFSRSTFSSILKGKTPLTYINTIKRYINTAEGKTNRQLISEIYSYIDINHRNEYYYKNTLLNTLLINNPNHNPYTTVALTEIPIAKSKVDFVLINGKANVYEIKTELDNFERLSTQLRDYYQAFDHVSVVTAPCNEEKIKLFLKNNKKVGILILDQNGTLRTVREPICFRKNLSKTVMFNILRKSEYEEVLINLGKKLPSVSQFEYYKACSEIFNKIQINRLYTEYCKVLKKRCHIEFEHLIQMPTELSALAYFSKMNKNDYAKISDFLNQSYYKENSCTIHI